MKTLLITIATLTVLGFSSCKKEVIEPKIIYGQVTFYARPTSGLWYVEVNGYTHTISQSYTGTCGRNTTINLPEGVYTFKIYNKGNACTEASGFTEEFKVVGNSCTLSRINCSSYKI